MTPIRRLRLQVSFVFLLGAVGSCWAELLLFTSVFRHGNRYPTKYDDFKIIYPRNPYRNATWFPNSGGELTKKGKLSAFVLGEILRERYGEWLGPTYSRDLVDFRSSHPGRCIAAASLVAAGLFPPSGRQRWNPGLSWQPIPVLPYPHEENILFFGPNDCEGYVTALEATRSSDPAIVEYDKRMQHFYDYVSNHTDGPINNRILQCLNAEFVAVVDAGVELPHWAQSIYYNGNFSEAAIDEFLFSSWTDELKSWTGGVWLKEWLDHVDAYLAADNAIRKKLSEGKESVRKKAYFYAGHDLNIAGILITLGIYYRHVPNYASAINFELHDDDNGRFYVKVLHRNSGNFTEYIVPGCGNTLCPLETFRDIFASVITLNATEKCGRHIYL